MKSQTAKAARGELASKEVVGNQTATNDFAMTPENHASQVFDLIAAGKFYVLTDNVRPYVDTTLRLAVRH